MAFALFIAVMASLSLFAWYITRKEKRSFNSWLSEKLLQLRLTKGWFNSHVDPEQFLDSRSLVNEQPYVMPPPLKFLGIIERKRIADMDCILLSERSGTTRLRILYLHGGAYVEQPILPHWLFLDRINNQSNAVITVPLYPKAPVHTVGETFPKITELYASMVARTRGEDVVIMGDSAGGGLALALAQQIALLGLPRPKAVIMISPWLDLSLRNASIDRLESKDPMLSRRFLQLMGKAWAGSTDLSDWRVSPINGPFENLPPLTLFVGTHEIFLADARKLVMLCTRKGVRINYHEYPKMNHDFPLFPIKEAREAQREIVRVIKS